MGQMHSATDRTRFAVLGWISYEFARNPYFTVVVIFLFAPYFANHVVGDPVRGQEIWGYVQAAIGAVIAIGSPVIGAVADAAGDRRRWIFWLSMLSAVCCALLWFVVPQHSFAIVLTIGALLVATVSLELAAVFHNSILTAVAPPRRLGWVSGISFGVGNAGGLGLLAVILLAFSLPDSPWLGIDKQAFEHDRISGPASAIWLVVFTIPFMALVPSVRGRGLRIAVAVGEGLRNLRTTLKRARHFRDPFLFLVARMTYNDGMLALQQFAGVYVAGVLGWGAAQLGIFGIVLMLSAGIGGAIGGRIDDHAGSKQTILVGLSGLLVSIVGLLSIGPGFALFGLVEWPREAAAQAGSLFARPEEKLFLAIGALSGAAFGAVFVSSRAMMARLAPKEMMAEFFGLYALSGTITAFAAPLALGLVTTAFGDQRIGFSVIAVFVLLGGLILLRVRTKPPPGG